MSIIRLPIDVKSLYFNIKNDNETGHTPTVATPLKQGASIHEELVRIVEIPENIASYDREELISKIQSKSRVQAKINNIFVFDRIAVNGILLEGVPSFCMYIREETDPNNIHYGRQKVHYPISLVFEDRNIHNKNVIKAISDYLCNYAFLVYIRPQIRFNYMMSTFLGIFCHLRPKTKISVDKNNTNQYCYTYLKFARTCSNKWRRYE